MMDFDDLVMGPALRRGLEKHREMVNMMLRTCPRYKDKPPNRATLYRWARDGVKTSTPRLRAARRKVERTAEQAKEQEERNAIHRERYRDSRVWTWTTWRRIRDRAARKGMDFNLTYDDLILPEFCPVLGLKMSPGGKDYASQQNSPSVDRIDNSKGYVKGNVAIISKRANSIKSDATAEELARVLAYMISSVPKT